MDLRLCQCPGWENIYWQTGYIDAWGRGTLKIINSCREANLPEPDFVEFNGGLLVTLLKELLSDDQLKKTSLNTRQVRAVQYVAENKTITNKEYQKINHVSKATATRDLTELCETHKILIKKGSTGAGTKYEFLKGS